MGPRATTHGILQTVGAAIECPLSAAAPYGRVWPEAAEGELLKTTLSGRSVCVLVKGTLDSGNAQRQKPLAAVIDFTGTMTGMDLRAAAWFLDAVTIGRTRGMGKAWSFPCASPITGVAARPSKNQRARRKNNKSPAAVQYLNGAPGEIRSSDKNAPKAHQPGIERTKTIMKSNS